MSSVRACALPPLTIPLVSGCISIITLLLLAGSVDNGSDRAYACEILTPPAPPLEMLDESAAVFSGKVTDIQRGTRGGGESLAIFFEVNRYWKSPNANDSDYSALVVFTAIDHGACGYTFELGKTYLVYASMQQDGGSLETGAGTRTQPIENAREDLAVLGAGTSPTKQVSVEEQINRATFRPLPVEQEAEVQGRNTAFPLVLGIGAAIAGAAAFFTLRNRRRR